MSILVHHERPIGVTVASGSWSANTIPLIGLIQQIIVTAVSPTAQFDFSLTDDRNIKFYERTDATGEIVEELNLPVNGVLTMAISNATSDGAYSVTLVIRER